MNRDTSCVVNIASSDCASECRSSRSVTPDPVSSGSLSRQSDVTTSWYAVPSHGALHAPAFGAQPRSTKASWWYSLVSIGLVGSHQDGLRRSRLLTRHGRSAERDLLAQIAPDDVGGRRHGAVAPEDVHSIRGPDRAVPPHDVVRP